MSRIKRICSFNVSKVLPSRQSDFCHTMVVKVISALFLAIFIASYATQGPGLQSKDPFDPPIYFQSKYGFIDLPPKANSLQPIRDKFESFSQRTFLLPIVLLPADLTSHQTQEKKETLKKITSLSGKWELSALFFFPNHVGILANLKNSATSTNQNYFFTSSLFNLGRHTISFRTVISLFAIFDLNRHNVTIVTNTALTNENLSSVTLFMQL